jgi:integral membrane protein
MKRYFSTPKQALINTGHVEGISFLLLLFIAMPLKYIWDMPMAVRIVGSVHGILFIAFISVLWDAKGKIPLSMKTVFLCFLLSIIPFGTFFIERIIPNDESPAKR